jgi:hypothetical protein
MKRPRPYIPLSVRLVVARRQAINAGLPPSSDDWVTLELRPAKRLQWYLSYLFGEQKYELDHDPALINRRFIRRTGEYEPRANCHYFLIYRKAEDHKTKTFVRGEHGQHSDLGLRRKNKRIARNRDRTRPRAKIKQRKTIWPKRKFGRNKNERAHNSKSTKQAATRLSHGSL